MNRRQFIRTNGAALGVLLAGCLNSGDSPVVEEKSVSVVESGCESTPDSATVRFNEDDSRLLIDGTIAGDSTCTDLTLSVFTTEADTRSADINVQIQPIEANSDENCESCTSTIEYRAEITFSNTFPASVLVKYMYPPDDVEIVTHANRSTKSGGG